MNTSTIDRGNAGRRLGVLLLGLAVALAGTLALSGSQAKADPFQMTFEKGQVNLGFAFQDANILPAPSAIPGSISNPAFNPANPVSAENPTTVISPTGTPLFDVNALNPATFSSPGVNGGLPASFTPLGCGTPVTFGIYAAMAVGAGGTPGTGPGDIILNPINQSASQPGFVINPIANAGNSTAYYRVLNKGAVVASTLANGVQAAGATLTVDSTSGFADSGTIDVGGDQATYTSKTGTTFDGVTGLDGPVADNAVVGRVASFVNPFTQAPQTITGPYPAENTLWQPYALDLSTFDAANPGTPLATPTTLPVGQNPTNIGGLQKVPFSGTPGLNAPQGNTVPGGFCANPANLTVDGDVTAPVRGVSGDGEVTIEPADFKAPVMIVPNPLDGSPVPITLEIDGSSTLEGPFTSADGGLDLRGDVEVRVLTGLASNPLGSYCEVPLPGREPGGFGQGTPLASGYALSTEYSLPSNVGFNGTPFDSGLEGGGALTGSFNVTEDSVSVGGANCATVNSVSKGLGAIWIGDGVETPAPYPTCQELGKVGTFPNCTNPVASIASVRVTGPARVKQGKTGVYKAAIRNGGTATATGVRLAVSGRGVAFSTPVGTIGAGATRTVTIRAKFRRTGTVKATFKATSSNAGSKQAVKTVRVVK